MAEPNTLLTAAIGGSHFPLASPISHADTGGLQRSTVRPRTAQARRLPAVHPHTPLSPSSSHLDRRIIRVLDVADAVESPTRRLAAMRALNAQALQLLTRQLVAECRDRGRLFQRVQSGYAALIAELEAVTQAMLDDMRAGHVAAVERLAAAREKHTKEAAHKGNVIHDKSKMVGALSAQVSDMESSEALAEGLAAADTMRDLRQRTFDLEAAIDAALAQLGAATTDLAALKASHPIDRAAQAACRDTEAAVVASMATLEERAAGLVAKRKTIMEVVKAKEGDVGDVKNQLEVLEGTISRHNTVLFAEARKFDDACDSLIRAKFTDRVAHAGTQAGADGGEGSVGGARRRAAANNRRHTKLGHGWKKAKVLPVSSVYTNVYAILEDRAKQVEARTPSGKANMADFVTVWITQKFGTGTTASQMVLRMASTMNKFAATSPVLGTFLRLWGVRDPMPDEEAALYLRANAALLQGPPGSVGRGHIHVLRRGAARAITVESTTAVLAPMMRVALGEDPAGVLTRVTAGGALGWKGLNWIDMDTVLGIVLEAYRTMMANIMAALRMVFTAADTNADGVLDLEEFTCLFGWLLPDMPHDDVAALHRDALEATAESGVTAVAITPDDFVQVCQDRGLLRGRTLAQLQVQLRLPPGHRDGDTLALTAAAVAERTPWIEERLAGVAPDVRASLKERLTLVQHLLSAEGGEEPPAVAHYALQLLLLDVVRRGKVAAVANTGLTASLALRLRKRKPGKK